jgi:hypothetical protein
MLFQGFMDQAEILDEPLHLAMPRLLNRCRLISFAIA